MTIPGPPVVLGDGRRFDWRASAGIACLPREEGLESLMQRADMTFYAANQAGRKRVEVASGATDSA